MILCAFRLEVTIFVVHPYKRSWVNIVYADG